MKNWQSKFVHALLAGGMMVPAMAAQAQERPDIGIDDIIVTAQKRSQNIQDIGVAVTAIGQEGLDMLGRQDVSSLVSQVPSLQVTQYNPNLTVFNIRGVSQNDFSDGQESPIAFYNDEVYIGGTGAISGQTFDLERIEVLRGPQGTLFGRNATGGLIQVVTAKPTPEFEAFATVIGGSFNQFSTEMAISGPLTDGIRGRLSFTSDRNDGFIRRPTQSSDGRRTQFYGARGQIEADVGERGTLSVKLEYLRNVDETPGTSHISAGVDENGLGFILPATLDYWSGRIGSAGFPIESCPGCDQNGYRQPDDPLVAEPDFEGSFNREYFSGTVRYEHKFDFATLTSISNYQRMTKRYTDDVDASPVPYFELDISQSLRQVSQELRLAGDSDAFNWVVGAYYLNLYTDSFQRLGTPPDQPLGFEFYFNARTLQRTESVAGFAQGEYKFSNLFSLIVGGRYSADWKELDLANYLNGFPALIINPSNDPTTKQRFENFSGKVELDVRPNDDTLLYISVNRGTKSGGFSSPTFPPFPPSLAFDQEVLTNYEAGFKLTLAGGRMTVNGAAFHYDYEDYQTFSFDGLASIITNNPAEINGLELEVSARPTRNLRIGAFATHLIKAQVRDIVLPAGGDPVSRRMPQTPDWSIGGNLSYEVELGGAGSLMLTTNWKYNTDQYFTAYNAPVDLEPGYVVGNARITYTTPNKHWEVAAFVNNLTDERFRAFNLDLSSNIGVGQSNYAPPRWFGASVTFRH